MIDVENWSIQIVPISRCYTAEQGRVGLVGSIDGNPPGIVLMKLDIESVDGRVVTTTKGRVFRIGEPAAEYSAWLDRRTNWDPENPIKCTALEDLDADH
jgi:hypothetical protein